METKPRFRTSSLRWFALRIPATVLIGAAAFGGLSCQGSSSAPPEGAATLAAIRGRAGGEVLPAGKARAFADAGGRLRARFDSAEREAARILLPSRAAAATHIEDADTGVAVDVAMEGARDVEARVAEGYVVFSAAHVSGATLLHRAFPTGVEDFVSFEKRPREANVAYRVALGTGAKGLRLVENVLEVLDEGGAPRLRVNPPYVVGADGQRRDATLAVEGCAVDRNAAAPWGRAVTAPGAGGCTLRVAWHDADLRYPAVLDPQWTTTANNLSSARQGHTATLLASGKVLVAGGTTGSTVLSSAELYDRTTNTWAATGSMTGARQQHAAVLLGSTGNSTTSGKVLVSGGLNGSTSQSTAQLYNETAGTWAAAANLNVARHQHTATLLADGKVLVAGGMSGSAVVMSGAIYNPASGTGTWTATGSMSSAATNHTATLLTVPGNASLNNTVLVVGGNSGSTTTAVAQVLSGTTWSAASLVTQLPSAREGHTATRLSSGNVLVTGGKTGATTLATAQVFNPSSGKGTWTSTGSLTAARQKHTATLLSDGKVLVVGGSSGSASLSSSELWNGSTWSATSTLPAAVQSHTATLLSNGAVLVAGGVNGSTTVNTARVYDPGTGATCMNNSQCASGFCVSGVCCNTACNGGCGACNLPGSVGTCSPVSAGASCRASAGTCDVAEACNGTSLTCPTDAFAAPTVTCRSSAGACDVAETCTGSSAACPADAFAASTVTCRSSAGACDVVETCTGSGASCPANGFVASGTTCRSSAGLCDPPEVCTGTNAACPSDALSGPAVTCRPSAGTCDVPEVCAGGTPACPADVFAASTVTCRGSAGACDVAETCTGSSTACPANAFAPSTVTCRAAAGVCDVAETCTGSGAACPADTLASAATTCRGPTGPCDAAEACTGSAVTCPVDLSRPDGTPCTDGNSCTLTDVCAGGSCVPGSPLTCPATDQCHLAVSCNTSTGQCPASPPKPNGTVCDDGNPATTNDSCQAGVCTGNVADPCANRGDFDSCDDGNLCTQYDYCYEGHCYGGEEPDCSQGGEYCAGSCDPATGACTSVPKPNGTACFDGDFCTGPDTCQAGHCQTGAPVVCQALDACHVAGTCLPSTGCSNPPKPEGDPCDDHNLCTVGDACQLGQCRSGAPVVCSAPDQCHTGVCDTGTGTCTTPARPNGFACTDANICTLSDTCQSGVCASGAPVVCVASDECHLAGTCDPANGNCTDPVKADGASCDDETSCTSGDTCHAGACSGAPQANCGLVAPPVDRTIATDFAAATSFIYTGTGAVQSGVAAGTIDQLRVSIIRGQVTDTTGALLGGVTVSVHGHPEFGETVTRADGMFDLAVNGGVQRTLDYNGPGKLQVQRSVEVPNRDYVYAPDVVMTALDPEVTVIDLPSGLSPTVVQGSPVTDLDGSRQATLIVPAGTTASMLLPNGTTSELPRISVRATEYTVGLEGPSAMPGPLPPTSGYTYAVEYSVDEALAVGAKTVTFSQPIATYVENFIGFAVGTAVPAGYYDRERAAWIGLPNGRVVKVVGSVAGLAELDIDGDDLADGAAALATLGITDAERAQLSTLYMPGQTLWRVAVSHFTPHDYNWPYGPPRTAKKPKTRKPKKEDKDKDQDPKDCRKGSSIACKSQTLGETAPITGSGASLVYQSNRVPGFSASRRLSIEVSTAEVPEDLKRIEVTATIAGQRYFQVLPPLAAQTVPMEWNGRDVFGRVLQGTQSVSVEIAYVYPAVYQTPAEFEASWASYGSEVLQVSRAALEARLVERQETTVSYEDATAAVGLGGWDLSNHHRYDPTAKTIQYGSGARTQAGLVDDAIRRIAGAAVPSSVVVPDGGSALDQYFSFIHGIAGAPNGDLLVMDNGRLRRIAADGTIWMVAGGGQNPLQADRPASQVYLDTEAMAVTPDGTVYFVPFFGRVLYKIDANGIVRRVAGDSQQSGDSGDGGPALEARLGDVDFMTAGPDGTVYLADRMFDRIRRVTPDGIISPVAGGGTIARAPDGVLATDLDFAGGPGLAVNPDGELIFEAMVQTEDGVRTALRKVGTDGRLSTVHVVTNTCPPSSPGQRGAPFIWNNGSGPRGEIYFMEVCGFDEYPYFGSWLKRLDPNGTIATIAGAGPTNEGADERHIDVVAAHRWPVHARGTVVGRDGIYFYGHHAGFQPLRPSFNGGGLSTVFKITPALPGVGIEEIKVPSQDGREIDVFSAQGRHLRTIDSLTGVVRQQFQYTTSGLLAGFQDAHGLATTIERDSSGSATAIVAPSGRRTTLTIGTDGLLSAVKNAANESTTFGYHPGGLLATEINAEGATHAFTFDPNGRLTKDERPANGLWTLSRSSTPESTLVTMTTGEGRSQTLEMVDTGDGPARRRSEVGVDGTSEVADTDSAGKETRQLADGTTIESMVAPDPRFGVAAPYVTSQSIRTPAGLTMSAQRTRSVTGTPASGVAATVTDTVVLNGRSASSTFDRQSRTTTSKTPSGRTTVTRQDEHGKLVFSQFGTLAPLTMTYDSRGRLTNLTRGSGGAARTATWGYDLMDRPVSMTDPLSRVSSLGYDPADRLASFSTPAGATTSYQYDSAGNGTSVQPPGRPATTFGYTLADQVASYLPPVVGATSAVTGYVYDRDRRLTEVQRPDGRTIAYERDSTGRLIRLTYPSNVGVASSGNTTITHGYSPTSGLLTSLVTSDGEGLAFTFDGGLKTRAATTGVAPGVVDFGYDTNFRMTSETIGGSGVQYGYDSDGLVTQIGALALARDSVNGLVTGTTIGSVSETVNKNQFDELQMTQTKFNGATLFEEVLTRDALGRVETSTETVGGVTAAYAYSYDLAGRLWQVMKDGATIATYLYDANGNRTSKTTSAGVETGTVDGQDRLESQGAYTFSYTANGELRTKTSTATGAVTTYGYDGFGGLRRVDLPDGRVIEYVVDGLSRRVAKKVNGAVVKRWLYASALVPAAELDASGAVESRIVNGEYIVKNGATYRIVKDHVGSPRILVNVATGAAAQRLAFDEYGRALEDSAPGFQPLGYAGGLYDPDTGLVRFGVRDYDPATGRWTAKDPILFGGHASNVYSYTMGDPINRRDPSGLFIETGNDAAAAAAVAEIAANPSIGPLIDRLAMDENITVIIGESPPIQQIINSGGANTQRYGDDPKVIFINYNMKVVNADRCAKKFKWLITRVLAHELGHAYTFTYGSEFQWLLNMLAPEAGGLGHGVGIYFENQFATPGTER